MSLGRKLVFSASLAALTAGGAALAQDQDADELRQSTVTVTGSFIQGTPEDAALPVDVLTNTADPADSDAVLAAGATSCTPKSELLEGFAGWLNLIQSLDTQAEAA